MQSSVRESPDRKRLRAYGLAARYGPLPRGDQRSASRRHHRPRSPTRDAAAATALSPGPETAGRGFVIRITIETIQHENQRYPTAGDWLFLGDTELRIRVSHLGDWKKELLVAVHELVEAALCRSRGISEETVTLFDKDHADALEGQRCPCESVGGCDDRPLGHCNLGAEPGDNAAAPYRAEHFFATSVERLLAAELGVDWLEYDKTVEAL